jgi:protein required for attachment to host cells
MHDLDVVIANRSEAKIYHYDLKSKNLELMKEILHPESKMKISEIMADEAGRYQKSLSPNKGTYEPHTDAKTIEEEKFARDLAHFIENTTKKNNNKIVIIAPNHFQNFIKNNLSKPVLNKVEDFYDKNYVNLETKNLEKHLSKLLSIRIGSRA